MQTKVMMLRWGCLSDAIMPEQSAALHEFTASGLKHRARQALRNVASQVIHIALVHICLNLWTAGQARGWHGKRTR